MRTIKKILIIFFITISLIFFLIIGQKYYYKLKYSYYQKQYTIDSLNDCDCNRNKINNYLKSNKLILFTSKFYSFDFDEILFKNYKIYVKLIDYNVTDTCGKYLMDNEIFNKYGLDFFDKIKVKADSIKKTIPQFLDIDGYYHIIDSSATNKCVDYETMYKKITKKVLRENKDFFEDNKCENQIDLDYVITKEGKLENIRILLGINSKIDSMVVYELQNLDCDWYPAIYNGESVNSRNLLFLFFDYENP
jgi:hypothetical protein